MGGRAGGGARAGGGGGRVDIVEAGRKQRHREMLRMIGDVNSITPENYDKVAHAKLENYARDLVAESMRNDRMYFDTDNATRRRELGQENKTIQRRLSQIGPARNAFDRAFRTKPIEYRTPLR